MSSTTEADNPRQENSAFIPRILSTTDHPITPKMLDPDALHILKKLATAGFSGYLVGGGVRDLYLGNSPKDFDISTDARPGQLRKLFPNSRTIGRRFRLVQVFFKGGKVIEVSTLRSLSEHDLDGPEVILAPNNTFGTLNEDARRRDLTINSLFYEIENGTIIDYVDGCGDLDNGIVRIVGDPEKRISRDPVRMIRAIRHSARNNFAIQEDTWKAITLHCNKLSLCPPSRIRDEILKDFYSGATAPWFELAFSSGIFTALFPFYKSIFKKNTVVSLEVRQQLAGIFQTIDRIDTLSKKSNFHRQADFFLFALLMIPWAESRFQLFSEFRKGADLFQLAKKIRRDIDQTLGIDLNLRRSLRQEVVNLLTTLSQLIHNRQNDTWPQWLQKKSYFLKCSLFYHFYIEATTGKPIPQEFLQTNQPHLPAKSSPTQKTSKGKSKPAFATKTKGGIFGFKN
jgi:poly(A) polymerase